jgi:hypothetical protein
MVFRIQYLTFILSIIMLFSSIGSSTDFEVYTPSSYDSNHPNLFVGGILEKSSNGDSAEQKWRDFADHNNAVFVPAYYSREILFDPTNVDPMALDINAVNAAARSEATDLNGLTRDELGANGPRSYGTIIGYSGGTTSVITAMAVQDVKAETLILISPMMGNNENSGEVFEQKIRSIIEANPNIKILVFQSEQDIMPGQADFLYNDYLLNMFPDNIEVYSIKLPLETCGLFCHNYFFDTWAKENIKNGAYVGSVVAKTPVVKTPISQVLGLSAPLWSQPTPNEYSKYVPDNPSTKVPTKAEFPVPYEGGPVDLPCV